MQSLIDYFSCLLEFSGDNENITLKKINSNLCMYIPNIILDTGT